MHDQEPPAYSEAMNEAASSSSAGMTRSSSSSSSSASRRRRRDRSPSTSKIDLMAPVPSSSFFSQKPGNTMDEAQRSRRRTGSSSSASTTHTMIERRSSRAGSDLSMRKSSPTIPRRGRDQNVSSIRSTAVTAKDQDVPGWEGHQLISDDSGDIKDLEYGVGPRRLRTVSKILQTGSPPNDGIWRSTAWDFTVHDWEGKDKRLPGGTLVTYRESAADDSMSEASQPAWRKPAQASNEDQVDTEIETEPASIPPYIERSHTTVTKQELEDVLRPFRAAYFSRSKWCWLIMAPIHTSGTPRVQTRLPLWIDSDPVTLKQTDILPPYPPARPKRPEDVLGRDELQLKTIEDTQQGRIVAYTDDTECIYPAVIPKDAWEALLEDHKKNPPLGAKDGNAAQYNAVSVFFRLLDYALFRGETRDVPINAKSVTKSLSWGPHAETILLEVLGYTLVDSTLGPALHMPQIDLGSNTGRLNRHRMLRCWIELAVWMEDWRTRFGADKVPVIAKSITLKPSHQHLLDILGGDQLPRQPSGATEWQVAGKTGEIDPEFASCFDILGGTPDLSDHVIVTLYHDQYNIHRRNFPARMPFHRPLQSFRLLCADASDQVFGAVEKIGLLRQSDAIQDFVRAERKKGAFTEDDLRQAYRAVVGTDGNEVHTLTEEQLTEAFTTQLEIEDTGNNDEHKKRLVDAFKLLSSWRQSELMKASLASLTPEAKTRMDAARAREVLGVPNELEEDMLITLYEIRLGDQPQQEDDLREALTVLGEAISSEKVKHYVKTGKRADEWQAMPVVQQDRPIGLTNIANTCYLNSLLQYFFTVRELRETILQFSNGINIDSLDAQSFNRVGGRRVTRREIERSIRFANLLKTLFQQLVEAPVSAVTPETELAYLALVPNKDEVDSPAEVKDKPAVVDSDGDFVMVDKQVKEGESSSVAVHEITTSPLPSPTVLGKRNNDQLDEFDFPKVDQQAVKTPLAERDANSMQVVSDGDEPSRAKRAMSNTQRSNDSPEMVATEGADGVVEIRAADDERAKPPPLPPRPPQAKQELQRQVSEYMAFGRQNDVTECMDNVMFQLECALNPTVSSDGTAVNLLKRTFFGKMKQQLDFVESSDEPARVQEEPFFSLLVDVAEEGRDVYDGLDTVFDDAAVEIDGKQASRRISLVEVPTLLQIQLQRVQYDRVAQRIFKSNAHMAFEPTLSLDRYLDIDPNDALAREKRDRTSQCRRRLEAARAKLLQLRPHKDHGVASDVRKTIELFGEIHDELEGVLPDDFVEVAATEVNALESDIAAVEAEIASLRKEMNDMWSQDAKASYELVAVFMHRGTATSGHYFLYQRDSEKPERWFKYNDAVVTEVNPAEEVFCERSGDTNPYFLAYCRRDQLNAVTSARK